MQNHIQGSDQVCHFRPKVARNCDIEHLFDQICNLQNPSVSPLCLLRVFVHQYLHYLQYLQQLTDLAWDWKVERETPEGRTDRTTCFIKQHYITGQELKKTELRWNQAVALMFGYVELPSLICHLVIGWSILNPQNEIRKVSKTVLMILKIYEGFQVDWNLHEFDDENFIPESWRFSFEFLLAVTWVAYKSKRLRWCWWWQSLWKQL